MNAIEKTKNVRYVGNIFSSRMIFLFKISAVIYFDAINERKIIIKSNTAKTYLYFGYFILLNYFLNKY